MKKGWRVERLYQDLTGFIMSESIITYTRTKIRVGKASVETCQVCWLERML